MIDHGTGFQNSTRVGRRARGVDRAGTHFPSTGVWRHAREFVLDEPERRFAKPHDDVWEAKDFMCRELAAKVYLLTCTLIQDRERITRRATVWQRTPEGWKIVYHQGTVVQGASGGSNHARRLALALDNGDGEAVQPLDANSL